MPGSEQHSGNIDISIVIPCHNEASGLKNLEAQLSPVLDTLRTTASVELVLVDDGSSDETWERAYESPFMYDWLLSHARQ